MRSASKKNMPAKKEKSAAKGLKRSKSTEMLVPKKSVKARQLERQCSEETILTHSMSKSKSAKTLKPKPKSQHKSDTTTKKLKSKKLLSPKTMKKTIPRSSNENSSILTEDWLCRKPPTEYFIYGNSKIPIENSAQRRLVYKIQLIDLENKMELDNKSTFETFLRAEPEDRGVGTDIVLLRDMAVGEKIENENRESQTDQERKSY
jgi:hypothetical protein